MLINTQKFYRFENRLRKSELKTDKFDNVILFNVLEHIFNFKTCLNNCYSILKDNGFLWFYPFLFRIHYSPNDYFRYTEQSILKF